MADKKSSIQKRPLTRVREGVVLGPGEDLYYDKSEGYSARRKVSNAGAGRGFVNPSKKGYAKGGSVRGNGCATRGFGKLSKNG